MLYTHCNMYSVLGRCVLNMDHYCPWMCNTVGFYNYRYFVLFLVYLFGACVYVILFFFFETVQLSPIDKYVATVLSPYSSMFIPQVLPCMWSTSSSNLYILIYVLQILHLLEPNVQDQYLPLQHPQCLHLLLLTSSGRVVFHLLLGGMAPISMLYESGVNLASCRSHLVRYEFIAYTLFLFCRPP